MAIGPAPAGHTVGDVTRPDASSTDPLNYGDASARARGSRAVRRWLHPLHLATALRTAIAAMGAWLVGNLLPGGMDEYAYAAALGAFVTAGGTAFAIARTALQTALGLIGGAALGLLLFPLDIPELAKIGIIAIVGILLPGIARLASGAGMVPVAALLVIMFGRIDPDGYAIAYVSQFTIGMIVGVIVNLVALPPLHDTDARERIRVATLAVADRIEAVAEMLRGEWPPERQDWTEWAPELETWIADLSADMRRARESRRLNLRTLWRRHDVDVDTNDLAALQAVVHRAVDVLYAASGAAWSIPIKVTLDADERALLADASQALGAHVRSWADDEDVAEASEASKAAIEALYAHVHSKPQPESGAGSIIFSLRAMRERIDRVARPEEE